MWTYNKTLQYPINIKCPDPRLAKVIISQYGGPDGELAASLRYLSQRFGMPDQKAKAILNDIGTEELAHLEMVGTIVHQLTDGASIEEIEKELKVDKDDIIIAMESNNSIESIEGTSNQSDKEGKKLSILDKISTGKNEEEIITNKIVIKQLLKELEERDREIILLRFFKEKTQTEVARILGISQVQVSRIERKVLDKMKNKLTSA